MEKNDFPCKWVPGEERCSAGEVVIARGLCRRCYNKQYFADREGLLSTEPPSHKLSVSDMLNIQRQYEAGEKSMIELSKHYGVTRMRIHQVCKAHVAKLERA